MKLVARSVPKDVEDLQVSLLPEDPEDMWHAYNLIVAGDLVHGHALRKVVSVNAGTNASSSERVHTDLTIKVKSTFFDPAISSLRVSGVVVSENDYVPLGSHHTLDIEVSRSFTLIKPDGWDTVAKDTLSQALSDDKNGAMAAVVMQEGLANICLITQFRTVLKTRVESVVPKKRDAASDQDAGMRRFYDKTLSSLLRAMDFSESRPLLLASPGFVATDFKEYIAKQGRDKSDKVLTAVAKQATVIHSNTGHIHSLNEVLKSPEVLAKMKDMKFAREAQYIDAFFDLLKLDDGRAWYGSKAVEKAVADGAVGPGGGVLLINNSLFRSEDLAIRKKYVALVDKVKADGGEARILSSDHESGQRLSMMGDIAAMLNYPMLDLDDDDEEEEAAVPVNGNRRQEEEDIGMLDSYAMALKLSLQSTFKLKSGYELPLLGFGVYQMPKENATDLCKEALKIGYRHIDSASSYRNQGQSAASIPASGISRSEVFFTTKVPRSGKPLGYKNVLELVETALAETKLDYLDLVLIHSPYGGIQARRDSWRALVESVEAGKVRSIGVSNYGVHHLDELEAYIKELEAERGGAPGSGGVLSVGQWEVHPWLTRPDIVKWCQERGVAIQAYCPIVRGQKFGDLAVKALADKYGKTEAQILLRWSLQRGYVPLIKSATPSRIAENAALYDFELTDDEVEKLATSDYSPCAWDPTVEPLEK
ncbi:Protein pelota [Paramyrothecium foliicola]|nr:Protein pelota [Paramyrothecium foliicola]